MVKRDEQAEYAKVERAFKTLRDTLHRAAKNADALALKPEVKAWLVEQFGPDKPKTVSDMTPARLENVEDIVHKQLELEKQATPPVTDKALEKVREIVRQRWEQEHPTKETSGKNRHAETEQRKRKSMQDGDSLPPH